MSAAGKGESIGLDVTIMGREYRVACKPDEQRELLDAVAYVDRQMKEIRDGLRQNNAERVAVMAALNIANDLLRAKSGGSPAATPPASGQPPSANIDLEGAKRRIHSMRTALDAALAEQENGQERLL